MSPMSPTGPGDPTGRRPLPSGCRARAAPRLLAAGYAVVLVGLAALVAEIVRAGPGTPGPPRLGTVASEVPALSPLLGIFATGLGVIVLTLAASLDAAPGAGATGAAVARGSRRRRRLVALAVGPGVVAPLLVLRAAARPVPLALFVVLIAAALLLATASAVVAGPVGRPAAPRPNPSRRAPTAREVAVVRAGGQLELGLFGLFAGMAAILLVATAYVLASVDGASAGGALQTGAALATALLLVPHAHAAWLARDAVSAAGVRAGRLVRAAALQRAAAVAAVPTALLVAAAVATSGEPSLPGTAEAVALVRALVLLLGLHLAAFSTDRIGRLAPGGAGDLSRARVAA